MNTVHISRISTELDLKPHRVQAAATLLEEGSTVPFIARYRKEATASLDEVSITNIRDRLKQLESLDNRRSSILKSLEKQGHLNDELLEKINNTQTLSELEDIYLPFRPKRRTKGSIAREKGLAPLAEKIFQQSGLDPYNEALSFVAPDKGVESVESALSGARDIIAEMINEDPPSRAALRRLFAQKGALTSRVVSGKENSGKKYSDYFEWDEAVATAPSHRILAMRRGEKEDVLDLTIAPPESDALRLLEDYFLKKSGKDSNQIEIAVRDSYKRLLSRSLETEARLTAKERADSEAITIFAQNLRELLLSPPLGAKRVMGIDPGIRTGCKVVCLDRQGKLLHHDTLFISTSAKKSDEAAAKAESLCDLYRIEAIAIGNGTGGRETEAFMHKLPLDQNIQIILVNESGASIYSASEIAREEFPELDLVYRGAVSIARRLIDPLAELVKIDPKSIGVGQYQHDVDQAALKQALDDVVISCVNSVGVDVNSASAQLLSYVSGLRPQLARNIVNYRNENGPFSNRKEFNHIPGLGPRAYEQSAGFLRIKSGTNPLDAGAVHPESYPIVNAMAQDLNCSVTDLMTKSSVRDRIDVTGYVTDKVGIPTLHDIITELARPGRDPRDEFEIFSFADNITTMGDLITGMTLPGIVTNVTAFGAFVDIGVHQDGLVHISELSDRYIKDPATVVRVHQKVSVTVLQIDLERKRISLSMKKNRTALTNS